MTYSTYVTFNNTNSAINYN